MRSLISAVAFAAADASTGPAPAVAPLGTEAAKQAPNSNVAAPAKPSKPRVAVKTGKRTSGKPTAAKPGKATAKAEAKPDPRAERATRIAAERADVHALYAHFETNRVSVPVKPLAAFKPETTTAHPIKRNPSARQAAAIAVAFSAAGRKLSDGATAPRVFEHNGKRTCIENGALRDAVSSGLITVSGDSPETELLRIAPKATAIITGLIGARAIKAGKLA